MIARTKNNPVEGNEKALAAISCIEGTTKHNMQNKLLIVWDAADDGCEVLVELVFCIRCCGHFRGIHADTSDWACTGVES